MYEFMRVCACMCMCVCTFHVYGMHACMNFTSCMQMHARLHYLSVITSTVYSTFLISYRDKTMKQCVLAGMQTMLHNGEM